MASAPLRLRSVRAVTVATAVAAPFALAAPIPATATAPAPAATAPGPGAPAPAAPEPPGAPRPPVAPAVPAPDPTTPGCGTPDDDAFPLDTRILGGPARYAEGGPFQDWRLDLTNTTGSPCSGIHPVLVLTDRDRVLRPGQIRFEFYDAGAARWHPVAFQETSEAENVGVFTDFGGFSVPAGETLTVPVRLAFRAGTAPGEVVVNAAIVQRRGADGDWIGDSGDYRLTVGPRAPDAPTEPSGPTAPPTPAEPPRSTKGAKDTPSSGPSEPPGPPKPPVSSRPAEPVGPTTSPGSRPPADQTASTPPPAPATPTRPSPSGEAPGKTPGAAPGEAAATPSPAPELAHTGRASDARARALAPLAAALLLLGAALVRAGRRHRRA
ncbi:hypothetical protein ACFUJ0_20960 [Streptomyces sp. NPDC057242]|uniref:hypothetical protein n=1 Tax=unclassified Streptomyces TaxID=2593676 RepID=UPI00362981E4